MTTEDPDGACVYETIPGGWQHRGIKRATAWLRQWRSVACLLLLLLPGAVGATPPFDSDSQYLLGDWGGLRPALARQGVTFNFGYTGEIAYNLDGGFDESGLLAYADQFVAGMRLDLTTLLGLPHAVFQLTLTNRNGENLANERLVDPATGTVSSVQEIYGRGNVTRLTQLWYQQSWFEGGLTMKLGRIPLSDDFATLDSHFQNLYLGSSQPGNQAGSIWYNWPVSQWGVVMKATSDSAYYLQVGVFDLNPENLDPDSALSLYHDGSEGVLVPVELGWTPSSGPGGLPGKYKIGVYYSSAEATDYDDGGTTGSRHGIYFVVQQRITAYQDGRGLTVFVQGSWHDDEAAYISHYASAGATYQGPFAARPKDDIGIGLAYAEVSDNYVGSITAGNASLPGPSAPGYVPPQTNEWNAELYYGVNLAPWLTVRPNMQYIIHPGANTRVEDAWVLGTQVNLVF